MVRRSLALRRTLYLAMAALVVESGLSFPNHINFFNAPTRLLTRSPLTLLGDSNLDWGQDLPALARFYHDWRATNKPSVAPAATKSLEALKRPTLVRNDSSCSSIKTISSETSEWHASATPSCTKCGHGSATMHI